MVREGYVPTGRGRLYVREIGDGLPIVVLHGGPDFDHEYLLPELDGLTGLGARLTYYDQRGRGRSFNGEGGGDVTLESEIEDLDRVREWSGSESVTLLGHSWGGLLAMEYAIWHPERVSHLILMNTAPASYAGAAEFDRHLAATRTPAEAARMAELRDDPAFLRGDLAADAEYNRLHFRPALARPADVDEVVRRLRRAFTPESLVAARAIEESLWGGTLGDESYDLIPQLQRLRVPTLLIHGDHDFIPIGPVRLVAEAIRGARLLVLPESGHFAYMEQPARVRRAIEDFLRAA